MKLELNFHPAKQRTREKSMLFVHGMAHGAWCWEKNFVPYFNQLGYHCYALSLRGHGGSEGKGSLRWHSIHNYLEDFEWALSEIGTRPICVGHSMGGFIIQKHLLQTDNLAAFVGVASVPHTGMWRGAFNLLRKYPLRFLLSNLRMDTIPFSSSEKVVRAMCCSPDTPAEIVQFIQSRLQSESYRAFLDLALLDFHRAHLLHTPSLFLHSANDIVLFEGEMKNTAKQFGGDYFAFDDVGHDMMLDTNWQKVADKISSWLNNKQL